MNAMLLATTIALGDKIERYGAYFGYAAVIGLGVLSMLYFAQAREVKRLREWAGRAPDRDADLAARTPGRAVAPPLPRAAVPVQGPGPQTPAAQQADAARKAAAATVLEKFQPPGTAPAPAVGPPGSLARPAVAGQPGTVPGVPTPAAPGAAGQAPGNVPGQAPGGVPAVPGPPAAAGAPATAAPPEPGLGVAPSVATAGAVAAARQAAIAGRSPNGSGAPAAPPPLPTLPPEMPTRRREVSSRGPSRVGLYVGGAFTVIVIVVALVLVLTSGGGGPAKQANKVADSPAAPPASGSRTHPSAPAVDRKATHVAVLNGTTQNGLAASVAAKIEQKGFTILSKATNPDQKIATTSVSYASGQEAAAKLVAKIVDVPPSSVQPIDPNTATTVTAQADVAVIIGDDVASTG